jgi:hypothetical protein
MLQRKSTGDLIFITDVSQSSKLTTLGEKVEILISSPVNLNNLDLNKFCVNTTLDIIYLNKKITGNVISKESLENSELLNKVTSKELQYGLNKEETKSLIYNYKLIVDLNISANTEKDFNLLNIGTINIGFNYDKIDYSVTAVIQIVKEKNIYYKNLIFRE